MTMPSGSMENEHSSAVPVAESSMWKSPKWECSKLPATRAPFQRRCLCHLLRTLLVRLQHRFSLNAATSTNIHGRVSIPFLKQVMMSVSVLQDGEQSPPPPACMHIGRGADLPLDVTSWSLNGVRNQGGGGNVESQHLRFELTPSHSQDIFLCTLLPLFSICLVSRRPALTLDLIILITQEQQQ